MRHFVFHLKKKRLYVRESKAKDSSLKIYQWNDDVSFSLTESSDYTVLWTSFIPDLPPLYAKILVEIVSARYPLSHDYSKLSDLCPQLTFHLLESSDQIEEIVFFGGSFQPWHEGHQSCLNLLPNEKTCFILPDRNPEKKLQNLNTVSTILQISTHARFKENQFLVPTFLLSYQKNPTVKWISKFTHQYSSVTSSLLLGFDSFNSLTHWIDAGQLLACLQRLYVVPRLETDKQRETSTEKIRKLNKDIEIIFLDRHQFEHLSSTKMRKE